MEFSFTFRPIALWSILILEAYFLFSCYQAPQQWEKTWGANKSQSRLFLNRSTTTYVVTSILRQNVEFQLVTYVYCIHPFTLKRERLLLRPGRVYFAKAEYILHMQNMLRLVKHTKAWVKHTPSLGKEYALPRQSKL